MLTETAGIINCLVSSGYGVMADRHSGTGLGGGLVTVEEESRVTASFLMGSGLAMWAGEQAGVMAILTVGVGSQLSQVHCCESLCSGAWWGWVYGAQTY